MAISTARRVELARQAGKVARYHARSLVRPESVAEHTFNVLNLIMIITEMRPSYRLITAALLHDMGEYATGDIPSPVKRAMDQQTLNKIEAMEWDAVKRIHPDFVDEITVTEKAILKFADNLDGLFKCCEELELGNQPMIECGENYANYVADMLVTNTFPVKAVIMAKECLQHWKYLRNDK